MIALPNNDKKWKIRIVCEGFEEDEYIKRLVSRLVFSNKYEIKSVNAKAVGNVFSKYQELYQSNSYHMILIFCDTDKSSKSTYLEVKEKINKYHEKQIANRIIIFGNPTTMQIILSHFGKVELKSQSKHKNQQKIEELTQIKGYHATKEQRDELFSKINRRNYKTMKENLKDISTDDSKVPSTNILEHLERLEGDDASWIEKLNSEL